MYGDILEELRDGLAVSSSHDARLMRGITNAARALLRTYNFRESVRKAIVPIAASAQSIALPADAGKIKGVLLTTTEGGTKLFKRLRRLEEGALPYYNGPSFYYTEGQTIVLDSPMPVDALGYNIELWYQSDDPVFAEPFLSGKFADVLEHKAGRELALKMRKQEAFQFYGNLWEEDVAVLGRYMPEIEFGDLIMSMGEINREVVSERYPAA